MQRSPATRRGPTILFLASVLGSALVGPQVQARDGTRFTVRAMGAALSPAGNSVTITQPSALGSGEEQTTLGVSEDTFGFGLGLSYRLNRRLSIELAVLFVDLDSELRRDSAGIVDFDRTSGTFQTVAIGVDWHLRRHRSVGVRLGAFVAETTLDDARFFTQTGRPEKLAFDDDHGIGIKLGFDVPFRPESRWMVTGDARYLVTILESETAGQDLDLDPLIISIGVGFRF